MPNEKMAVWIKMQALDLLRRCLLKMSSQTLLVLVPLGPGRKPISSATMNISGVKGVTCLRAGHRVARPLLCAHVSRTRSVSIDCDLKKENINQDQMTKDQSLPKLLVHIGSARGRLLDDIPWCCGIVNGCSRCKGMNLSFPAEAPFSWSLASCVVAWPPWPRVPNQI